MRRPATFHHVVEEHDGEYKTLVFAWGEGRLAFGVLSGVVEDSRFLERTSRMISEVWLRPPDERGEMAHWDDRDIKVPFAIRGGIGIGYEESE